jgi:glycosyltransferase involved in cell wall biosynthesis
MPRLPMLARRLFPPDVLTGFTPTIMKSDTLVSVIIPTYNRAGIISQTIDNIFQQTYRNFELIIVDDGSTDDTQSKLRQYGDRIRVVKQTNAGPAVARNHGARLARGEIIAFQDSDDLWKPTKLERQVALLEMNRSVSCCLCNVLLRVVDGKPLTSFDFSLIRVVEEEGIWLNVLEVLATRFVLFNQAAAIRREAFERLDGFDQSLKYLEDYDLPLRLALQGPWAVIREPLVLYREGTAGSFSQQALKDSIVLKECELKLFERIQISIGDGTKQRRVQRHVTHRLAMLRRQLKATKLARSESFGLRAISRLLVMTDHYLMAAFRRSPWFPQPIMVPVSQDRS